MNRRIKYILALAFGALFSITMSCRRSDDVPQKPERENLLLELCAKSDIYHTPIYTRATADENYIYNRPWVIVFEGNDNNALFSEAQQAIVVGDKTYIQLRSNPLPCRLLVLGNPSANFMNGAGQEFGFDKANLTSLLTGQTLEFAVNNLRTAPLLASPQPTPPFVPDQPLPMSAMLQLPSININTVINDIGVVGGGDLKLRRSVARVDVDATAVASSITLLGATAVNVPRNGYMAQISGIINSEAGNLTNYYASVGDGVEGISTAVGNSTSGSPIYVYESNEAESSIIIKCQLAGEIYYYRLAFVANKELVPIKRNNQYTFVINSISRQGYATFQDALANESTNRNVIDFELRVVDYTSYEIADNGAYFMGLSNSFFEYFEDNGVALTSVNSVTVSTDAPTSLASQTAIYITSATPAGSITLTNPLQQITLSSNGSVVSTNILLNYRSDFQSGMLTLKIGEIIRTVQLNRRAKFNYLASYYIYPTNYLAGEVTAGQTWLFVNPNTNPSSSSTFFRSDAGPTSIYLTVTENTSTTQRTAGEVYLSRNNYGRIKAIVTQRGRP